MEMQDKDCIYDLDGDPPPPEYEKSKEIQELDASGQVVTTVTVLNAVLVGGLCYDDSAFTDDFISKYPASRVHVSFPRRSHSWIKSFMDIFLPTGYPNSVTADYMEYQIYDSLQAFSSSIAGLIASRAVLEGVGVGDPTASPTTALLLSVLQDTTGRIATILFAARLGLSLEPECKRWRLVADILNDAAMVLDCLSPALPKPLRVCVLSCAAALRALCGVAAGSAKASLSAHFAKSGNLGELNAKDSSQETIISLLGMLAGTALIPFLTTTLETWGALILLLTIHLHTNHRAVRAVSLRTLNRQRASLLFNAYLSSPPTAPPRRPSTLPTPPILSRLETTIHLRPASLHLPPPYNATASFVTLSSLTHLRSSDPAIPLVLPSLLGLFAHESYILHYSPHERHVRIALKTYATPRTALKAWFCARVFAEVFERRGEGAVGQGRRGVVNEKSAVADEEEEEEGPEGGRGWFLRELERDLDWGPTRKDSKYSSLQTLDNLGTCVEEVSRIWPQVEKDLEKAGWEVDVGALETRAGRRISVDGEEIRNKIWRGREEELKKEDECRKMQRERDGEEKEKEKDGKEEETKKKKRKEKKKEKERETKKDI